MRSEHIETSRHIGIKSNTGIIAYKTIRNKKIIFNWKERQDRQALLKLICIEFIVQLKYKQNAVLV